MEKEMEQELIHNDTKEEESIEVSDDVKIALIKEVPSYQLPSNTCCCDTLPSYPLYWPKVFSIYLIMTSIARIGGFIMDLTLFYHSIYFDHKFPWLNFKDELWIRCWLTFMVPYVYLLFLGMIYGNSLSLGNEEACGGIIMLCCCGVCLFTLIAIVYKFGMILLSLIDIFQAISLCRKNLVSNEFLRERQIYSYVFMFESVMSSWPLWILSLVEYQNQYWNHHNYDYKLSHIETLLLVKVICSGITILIGSDRLAAWDQEIGEQKKLAVFCQADDHEQIMQLCDTFLQTKFEANGTCKNCQNEIPSFHLDDSIKYFKCTHAECNGRLCTNCAVQLFQEYRDVNSLKDDEMASKLSSDYRGVMFVDQPVPVLGKSTWNLKCDGETSFMYRLVNHILIATELALMIPTVKSVWIDNKYEQNYLLYDSMVFIATALVLRILLWLQISINFLISKTCRPLKSIHPFMRWTINLNWIFYIFGYIMCLINFKLLWNDNIFAKIGLLMFSIIWGVQLLRLYCKVNSCMKDYLKDHQEMQRMMHEEMINAYMQEQGVIIDPVMENDSSSYAMAINN
eukprot:296590_1